MARLSTCLFYLNAVFGFSFCATLNVVDEAGPKSEKDLREYLFRDYDKLVRPVKNADDTVTVSVSIAPLRVRELNAEDQVLVLETLTLITWVDEYLKWDPRHFGNTSILRVPSSDVWRPDLAVYSSIEQSEMFPKPVTNVLLYDSGAVTWVPMFTIRSKCPLLKSSKKITCNIRIGSWTFSELLLDVQLGKEEVELSDYQDSNPDWKLVGVSSKRIQTFYPCCKEAYPSLNFNVTLKRRAIDDISTTLKDYDFEL